MARPKTAPAPTSRARGAGKRDALREALATTPTDGATGRALVDLLLSDESLTAAGRKNIAEFAERSLTPGDLAGLVAYRTQKLVDAATDAPYVSLATAWHNLSVFAVQVVQAQAQQSGAGGASVTIEWGGFRAPPPPAGRVARRSDPQVGDIVDAE